MISSAKEFFYRGVLVSVSLIFALLVGELAVRLITVNDLKQVHEYSATLGWTIRPNLDGYMRKEEYAARFITNSKGIRGREFGYDKKVPRILILGDSYTEGYCVDESALFSSILEKNLGNESTKEIEVINAGVSGYGTDQELLLFKNEGYKYSPDITILMFYANDLFDIMDGVNGMGLSKPYYEYVEGKLHLRQEHVPKDVRWDLNYGYEEEIAIYKDEFYQEGIPILVKLKVWLALNSELYHMVSKSSLMRPMAQQLGLVNQDFPPPTKNGPPDESDLSENSALFEQLLLDMERETSGVGSRLLVFCVPREIEIDETKLNAYKLKYNLPAEFLPARVGDRIEEVCIKNGIECINPMKAYKAVNDSLINEGGSLYYPVDGHWNSSGHELTATILSAYLDEFRPKPL